MESNNTSDKKQKITKGLAVAGVLAITLVLAWLSIQLVSMAPQAISSLASLAESVYKTSPTDNTTFTVTSNATVLQSGNNVTLSWEKANRTGSYIFKYNCTDGVAADIVSNDNELRSISCDTNYNVGDTHQLVLKLDSEKNRFIDVPYSVSFLATNDVSPRAKATGMIAVTNPQLVVVSNNEDVETNYSDDTSVSGETIEDDSVFNEEDENSEDNEAGRTEEEPAEELGEEDIVVTTPIPTQPTTQTPVFEQEFVYEIPVSDPNGRTDLSVRFIGVGELFNNRTLRETGGLEAGENGAIQFEIKNLGTKTSNEWEYVVRIDGDIIYRADEQEALKPNERSVITLAFPVPEDEDSLTVNVSVGSVGDRNSINDRFQETVVVN